MTRIHGAITPILCALFLSACSKPAEPGPKPPPPAIPVSVAKAELRDIPVELRSVGNVESMAAITLLPQVEGQVQSVPAGEGVDVNEGDIIVTLDPRRYQAALQEAEAALVKDKTLAEDERKAAEQLRTALAGKSVSEREAAAAEAKARASEAQAVLDQALIDAARLNVSYCTIRAPFAGRLGALKVKPGTVVKANETELIDLTQTAPIDVGFAVREQDIATIRAAHAKSPLKASVVIPGDPGDPAIGSLAFVDNRVDTTTGTLRLRVRFPNADLRLWPGQFVNVTLILGTDANAVVVPSSAVLTTQKGQSVYVIKADNTTELRTVVVRRAVDNVTTIDSGVQAGETVVTDGQLRLVPGSSVAIKPAAPTTEAMK